MRRLSLTQCAAAIVVLVTASLSAVWAAHAAGTAVRSVQDSNSQVTLSVPTTWSVRSPAGNTTLKAAAPTQTDGLPDSVDVVVHTAPSGMTAQSCISEAEWIARTFGHISLTTLQEGAATVAGLPAYAHVYTWQAPTGQSRWSQQVCIAYQGQVYVLTGTTANSTATLSAHAPVLEQIIDSVHILHSGEPASRTAPPTTSPPSQSR